MTRDLAPDEIREKTRNEIIARVGIGEGKITPEEAEKEAQAAGVGPLASYPPKDRFDPLKEPDWSLPMTAMWIIYRTPDAVREAWPLFRNEIRDWRDGALRPIVNIEVQLWDVISSTDSGAPPFLMSGLDAQEDLRKRLHNGELIAMGIPAGETEYRVVRKPSGISEWSSDPKKNPLSFRYYKLGQPADSIGGEYDLEPRYTQVQVSRDDVLKLWPAVIETSVKNSLEQDAKDQPISPRPKKPAKKVVEDWFTARKKFFLDQKLIPPGVRKDIEDCKKDIPGARDAQIKTARQKICPEWGREGGKLGRPVGSRSWASVD